MLFTSKKVKNQEDYKDIKDTFNYILKLIDDRTDVKGIDSPIDMNILLEETQIRNISVYRAAKQFLNRMFPFHAILLKKRYMTTDAAIAELTDRFEYSVEEDTWTESENIRDAQTLFFGLITYQNGVVDTRLTDCAEAIKHRMQKSDNPQYQLLLNMLSPVNGASPVLTDTFVGRYDRRDIHMEVVTYRNLFQNMLTECKKNPEYQQELTDLLNQF